MVPHKVYHVAHSARLILSVALLCCAGAAFGQVRGDVNGDGILNLVDAAMIRDHLLEKSPLQGAALSRADADGDGKIRMADVVYLINHLYGTITINVTPDSGSWRLTGPTGFATINGTGDISAINAPVGNYTLICNDNVTGYDPPSSETRTLVAGGTISFTPTYTRPNEITINLPGNVPLVLVRIPAGSFQMGALETERSHADNEHPQHAVNIGYNFYMGKYEVTQKQWQAVMGSNPAHDFGVGDNYPVYFVSWNDCQSFIAALNAHITNTGQGPATFRLPSEAEWEYACRAGTQTRFFFGDSLGDDDYSTDAPAGTLPGNRSDYMWFDANNSPYGSKPVGTKLPNQFGLYDMSGNIWEWCQDWSHTDYTGAPSDGSAWNTQDPSSPGRVRRGGHWQDYAYHCRSAVRFRFDPNTRHQIFGFRFVRTQ